MDQLGNPTEAERARFEELLPAYAIGACDADEQAFVDDMLETYPALAGQLEHFQGLNHALLTLMPVVAPPAALESRLSGILSAELSSQDADVPGQVDAPASPRKSWFASTGWRWTMGAAVTALLLVNVYWLRQNRMLQTEQAQLLTQISDQRAAIGLLSDDMVHRTEVFDPAGTSEAKASVIWNEAFPIAILYAEGFPQLAPDEAYQIWLIEGEERTSGGLFTVDHLGTGTIIMHLPSKLDDFSELGITPEPSGGSPGPTAKPVVRGPI